MALAKKLTSARVTLVTTPACPIPGRPFRIRAVGQTTTVGNYCRVWCVAAPPGTKLRKQLDDSRASRVSFQPMLRVVEGDSGRQDSVEVTLEKGGGYVFQIDELQVGDPNYPNFTGGYEDDPRGAPFETIKSSGSATLYVAAPLTMQLGCGSDTATLKLFVLDSTVVQTDLAVHGETTPRLDVSPSASSRARIASEDSDVRAALAGLAGQLVTTLVGDLGAGLDNLIERLNAHLVQSGRHYTNDDANAVNGSFSGATTTAARATSLREFRRLLDRHIRNDDGQGGGTGGAGYHSAADWPNQLLDAASPNDALTDGVAQADAWRAYEAHRVSSVHKHADAVNKASALPPLLALHCAFLNVLAAASPPTPPTAPAGAALLIAQLGFKDA